jgi:hypothetical protein
MDTTSLTPASIAGEFSEAEEGWFGILNFWKFLQELRRPMRNVGEPDRQGPQGVVAARPQMMMMSFICSYRNKVGAELHIYLEEDTYHKRLLRGPITNDMKKQDGPSLS